MQTGRGFNAAQAGLSVASHLKYGEADWTEWQQDLQDDPGFQGNLNDETARIQGDRDRVHALETKLSRVLQEQHDALQQQLVGIRHHDTLHQRFNDLQLS